MSPGIPYLEADPCPDVVPAVREWRGATGVLSLTSTSRIVIDSPRFAEMADRFRADLMIITGFDLQVADGTQPRPGDIHLVGRPIEMAAEGYVLEITDHVRLAGGSDAGVFYGTQTLLQLLRSTPGRRRLPRGQVRDWPRFAERGLLLDVGRKYWSPDYIVQTIRQLAYLRMNTIQLHFSDDNAFRLVSDHYPELAAPLAYSKADIRRFEEAANRCHVTIIPEIEMPSHSAAILESRPELGFGCASLTGSTLDVTKPEARQFARDLINEFAPLFAGPEFHIAADEYPTGEAQSRCAELARYAQQHGLGSPADVFVDFINDLNQTVRSNGKKMVIWNWWDVDQVPTTNPDPSIKIEAWTTAAESSGDHSPQKYLDLGYEVVVSPSDLLYVTPGFPLLPDPRYLYEAWTPQEHPRLAGYQLSVWANDAIERTEDSFDACLRRPLEILADRLWGGPRMGSVADFYARADRIGTAPYLPEYTIPGKLSGVPFAKITDGTPGHSTSDPDYRGIDLGPGQGRPVALIRYLVEPGETHPDRMQGGRFEGRADDPTSEYRTLAVITTSPTYGWNELPLSDAGRYRWLRYVAPSGGCPEVEVEYIGAPDDVAVTVPGPSASDLEARVDFRNTNRHPVFDVRLELNLAASHDRAAQPLLQLGPAHFAVVQPGESVSSGWQVVGASPLDAAGGYRFVARAVHQAQPGPDEPILESGGCALWTPDQVSIVR